MHPVHFSGSYAPDDVIFLLKVIELEPTPLLERELRIQGGAAHYSEMIGSESAPSASYLQAFYQAVESSGAIMAEHLVALASLISASRSGPLTLVSLARAGVPIGVLLARVLRHYFNREVKHYSISIIRDRGVDTNALNYILNTDLRPDSSLVFVDGWTGKGVISRELRGAINQYNLEHGVNISPKLHVLTDLCGEAGVAPGSFDFLIPSSILNSTVSGLISRTILNKTHLGPGDFHGCVYYHELASVDLSGWFIEQIMEQVKLLAAASPLAEIVVKALSTGQCAELRQVTESQLRYLQEQYSLPDVNFIKLGIGESTRVLLRRVPELLLLKDSQETDVQHLKLMADVKNVQVICQPDLSYRAVALIKAVDNG